MTESTKKQKRSYPLSAKINKIPITKVPHVNYTSKEKEYRRKIHSLYYKNNPAYKEYIKLKSRQWASIPENKMKRNVRQRLRRYKVKLNNQLPIFWEKRGFIVNVKII